MSNSVLEGVFGLLEGGEVLEVDCFKGFVDESQGFGTEDGTAEATWALAVEAFAAACLGGVFLVGLIMIEGLSGA